VTGAGAGAAVTRRGVGATGGGVRAGKDAGAGEAAGAGDDGGAAGAGTDSGSGADAGVAGWLVAGRFKSELVASSVQKDAGVWAGVCAVSCATGLGGLESAGAAATAPRTGLGALRCAGGVMRRGVLGLAGLRSAVSLSKAEAKGRVRT